MSGRRVSRPRAVPTGPYRKLRAADFDQDRSHGRRGRAHTPGIRPGGGPTIIYYGPNVKKPTTWAKKKGGGGPDPLDPPMPI